VTLHGSHRSGKTGKSRGILVVRERAGGKYFFGKVGEFNDRRPVGTLWPRSSTDRVELNGVMH